MAYPDHQAIDSTAERLTDLSEAAPSKRLALDVQFMLRALALADSALAADEVPVGALVVLDGVIIGEGHNRSMADGDPTAHAEVVALREAARHLGHFRLDDATLYVTLEPCMMCCGALLQARIARLVFGASEPRTGAVISTQESLMQPSNTHHVAITKGIEEQACASRLQAFFHQRREREDSR